ncbi:hypothetical protein Tcan_08399 [Toxocara canis]|uniref:Uncharacterized protein n=1 Tax=Toxocara canis TaxID=6265 RepID=A0A0B2VT06_TOXCA|nr:hypothetical protein Tcan_08399 [Toxocara canis]
MSNSDRNSFNESARKQQGMWSEKGVHIRRQAGRRAAPMCKRATCASGICPNTSSHVKSARATSAPRERNAEIVTCKHISRGRKAEMSKRNFIFT